MLRPVLFKYARPAAAFNSLLEQHMVKQLRATRSTTTRRELDTSPKDRNQHEWITLAAAGQQLGAQVGNIVTHFTMVLTRGSETGVIEIDNLPSANSSDNNRIIGTTTFGCTSITAPIPYGGQNGRVINLLMTTALTQQRRLENTNITDSLNIRGMVVYALTARDGSKTKAQTCFARRRPNGLTKSKSTKRSSSLSILSNPPR